MLPMQWNFLGILWDVSGAQSSSENLTETALWIKVLHEHEAKASST